YYLALGDSLAQGVQPLGPGGQDILTNQGYADDLYALVRLRKPGLKLVKLGCPDETTASMFGNATTNPSPCRNQYLAGYGVENQLEAAVQFMQTHEVELVTLDIGANDVDHCVDLTTLSIEAACLANGLAAIGPNLFQILTALRNAAGPDTRIVGMNYYDPFL